MIKRIPKVKFKEMLLKDNIELIKEIYSENNKNEEFIKYTEVIFPELSIINKDTSIKVKNSIINKIVTKNYNKEHSNIVKEIERYQKLWNEINDDYMIELSNYLDIKWPNKIKIINVTIGLIPIFPRYLNTFSYSICPKLNKDTLYRVSAHEILHFLWFEKWMELYPNTKEYEKESPYNVWEYSEMVTDSILNSKELSKVYKFNEKSYDYFYEFKDGNEYIMDKINEIFKSNLSIEDKILSGYMYILNKKM